MARDSQAALVALTIALPAGGDGISRQHAGEADEGVVE
jgi:hypothetical protein